MTEPVERPHDGTPEAGTPPEEPLAVPVETETAVQQLREAGFSEEQQAALTTALLRVLARWTQQATREDLHAEQQAMAQQLDALREDIRREVVQHADAVREELRGAFAQYADHSHTSRPCGRVMWLWLVTALLVLTSVGVILLVVHSVGGS